MQLHGLSLCDMEAKRLRALEKKKRYEEFMQPWPIQLAASKSKGRYIVAKEAIPMGTTIVTETASAHVLLRPLVDELCAKCLKVLPCNAPESDAFRDASGQLRVSKGVCCRNCRKQTFYCSEQCLQDDLKRHEIECMLLIELPGIAAMHQVDYTLLRLVLALLVQRQLEREASTHFKQTPFIYVKDLVSHKHSQGKEWLDAVSRGAEDFIQHLPASFNTNIDEIVTLACQINCNSHGLHDPNSNSNTVVGIGLFPIASMINHSCQPNCTFVGDHYGRLHIRTVKPVEKGDELTVSYVDLFLPREERRMKLLSTKHFWCTCERCESKQDDAKDFYLEGILCQACPIESKTIYFPNDDGSFTCQACGDCMTKLSYSSIQTQAESEFNDAFQLYKSHQTAFARSSMEKLLLKYEKLLHPYHHILFNTLVPLMNMCMRQSDIIEAPKYCRRVLEILNQSRVCPEMWPERADFLFALGQMEEVLSNAIESGLVKLKETQSMDCLKNAKDAFNACFEIRMILFGPQHPKTVEALQECMSISF